MSELVEQRKSGWSSSKWRWGYAVGDAHDAAAIARRSLAQKDARVAWLAMLAASSPATAPWEEVKLVMALAFQLVRVTPRKEITDL